MTLLIHLGYLTWHREDGRARIPNEEVRTEFRKILEGRTIRERDCGCGVSAETKITAPALVVELKWNKSSEGANNCSRENMIEAAYMTGILPIKKYETQSAMTDFREYTILAPRQLAAYTRRTNHLIDRWL